MENAIKLMLQDKHKQLASAPLRAEKRRSQKARLSEREKLLQSTAYLNEIEANGGGSDGIYDPCSDQEYEPIDVSELQVPPGFQPKTLPTSRKPIPGSSRKSPINKAPSCSKASATEQTSAKVPTKKAKVQTSKLTAINHILTPKRAAANHMDPIKGDHRDSDSETVSDSSQSDPPPKIPITVPENSPRRQLTIPKPYVLLGHTRRGTRGFRK